MEFGVFSVGDLTLDPTTGIMPTEHERIKAHVAIAKKVEEIGMDVFATGEHHNPPFFPSSPTTSLAYIAAVLWVANIDEPRVYGEAMVLLYLPAAVGLQRWLQPPAPPV